MKLDEFDQRLLDHFSGRFKKPEQLDYCSFDASAADIGRICSPDLFLHSTALTSFLSHNRLGLIGTWIDFPSFVGDLTIHCRREELNSPCDLAFLFLHLSPAGAFRRMDRTILKEWLNHLLFLDVHLRSNKAYLWSEFPIFLLALYAELGGDLNMAMERGLRDRLAWTSNLTSFIDDEGHACLGRIQRLFVELQESIDNQSLPSKSFIAHWVIKAILDVFSRYDGLIALEAPSSIS